MRCFGLNGCADTHYGGLVRVISDQPDKNWTGAEKDDTFTGGCITNIKNFVESIRAGETHQQRAHGGGEQPDRHPGPDGGLPRRDW